MQSFGTLRLSAVMRKHDIVNIFSVNELRDVNAKVVGSATYLNYRRLIELQDLRLQTIVTK